MFLLQRLIADKLFRNTSWMLFSEMVAKVSRIATVLVMAAILGPVEYGVAALSLACHELVRVFSRAGAGSRVIQCPDSEMELTARNASLLQWLICSVVFCAQWFGAHWIAQFYGNTEIKPLLQIMAFTYLMFPIVSVRVFLIQRANRMKFFSLANAITLSVDNILIVILLWLDFGIVSVAYSKVASVLAWVIIFHFAKIQNISPGFDSKMFARLSVLSLQIFTSETLRVLRGQLDVLIAGRLLTPELLGVYSFAKNAGVGLGQSIINAFLGGMYPYICEKIRAGMKAEAYSTAMLMAGAVSLGFIIQSLLAPVYLRVLFDSKWLEAFPLVSILCLGAIPAILIDTRGYFYRANGEPLKETLLTAGCVLIGVGVMLFFLPETPLSLAFYSVLSNALWLLLIAKFLAHSFFANRRIVSYFAK